MKKIDLFGTVGENFSPTTVRYALPASGDVTVDINSGGGFAADGVAIFNILRDHPGKITVNILGIAASAASLIAMAGDSIVMADGAVIMIHDPMQFTIGNSADHAKTIEELEAYASAYAKVYAKRAGISEARARSIMVAETWYDGPQAVAAGFATATGSATAKAYALYDYANYRNAAQAIARVAKSHPQIVARQGVADIAASWKAAAARANGKVEKNPALLKHGWDKIVLAENARHR